MFANKKGLFVISLDFELFWGVRDKRTIESYGLNIKGVRQVIPCLLDLFEKYEIHASFATVGFLFAKSKEELIKYIPSNLPTYTKRQYSPYEGKYLEQVGENEANDIYHYGGSLIEKIQACPNQEIASHTFSHYYCLEGAPIESFEADLIAAKKIALGYGIDLKSIVFPRNQYSQSHIEICRKNGFIAYRGNINSLLYNPRKNQDQNMLIRAMRFSDSYLNLTGYHTVKTTNDRGIVDIPASCFLRPYSNKLQLFDGMRMHRIKQGISRAANTGNIFHLWWHPHNFGINLKENLHFLEGILKHFYALKQEGKIVSKSMKELAEERINL